jgi:SAM-dependent methyltransferase
LDFLDWVKTHFGEAILLKVRPLSDRRRDEFGWCCVCGNDSRFVFNSWAIHPEQVPGTSDLAILLDYQRRESLFCRICCSSLRVRGIARALLDLYGDGATSMAELVLQPDFRRLHVAEINRIGAMGSLHKFLAQLPNLALSEYSGEEALGEVVRGVRNEDICRLTYGDQSFDLVLSSDTLEHVPDFRVALREVQRVLKSGGRHIFTVPIARHAAKTRARATVDSEGHLIHVMPPVYHGRGGGLFRYIPVGADLLVFTEFGTDLSDHIRVAGFEPERLDGLGGNLDSTRAAMVFSGTVPVQTTTSARPS